MFEYISGKIVEKKTTSIVLETNGIGYYITIPVSTYDKLGELGSASKLYIHFHVRENEQRLFGFATKEERIVFDSLLKVAGIGPKIAISILSGITIKDLFDVITRQDVKLLSTVPGIGKKSSERIIIELKDKFDDILPGNFIEYTATPEEQNFVNDAEDALISLGYSKANVIKKIQKFMSENTPSSAEDIVKAIIRNFLFQNMNPRLAAFYSLNDILLERNNSEKVLARFSSKFASKQDHNLYYTLVKGSIKQKIHLEFLLKNYIDFEKTDPKVLNLLLLGLFQLTFLDSIPAYACVNETINISNKEFKKRSKQFYKCSTPLLYQEG